MDTILKEINQVLRAKKNGRETIRERIKKQVEIIKDYNGKPFCGWMKVEDAVKEIERLLAVEICKECNEEFEEGGGVCGYCLQCVEDAREDY